MFADFPNPPSAFSVLNQNEGRVSFVFQGREGSCIVCRNDNKIAQPDGLN